MVAVVLCVMPATAKTPTIVVPGPLTKTADSLQELDSSYDNVILHENAVPNNNGRFSHLDRVEWPLRCDTLCSGRRSDNCPA